MSGSLDPQEGLRIRILSEQYRRCAEDIRHFDRLLWQIPFSTATVVGAFVTVAYGDFGGKVLDVSTKGPLLIFLEILVVTMFALSKKFRFFMDGRVRFLQDLEEKIPNIEKVPVETTEILKFLECMQKNGHVFVKYRAVHFSYLLYSVFIGALLYLLSSEEWWLLWGLIIIFFVIGWICVAEFRDRIRKFIK